MKFARKLLLGSVATAALLAANPALAQSNDAEMEALRAEVAALKAQLAELSAKVEKVAAAPAPAPAPVAVAAAEKKPAAEISWKGAPEIKGEGGWSFKPRGRLQIDAASINPSDTIATNSLGSTVRVRRAQFGIDGTIPGGFGYRVEADIGSGSAELLARTSLSGGWRK